MSWKAISFIVSLIIVVTAGITFIAYVALHTERLPSDETHPTINDRPIIGILSQELSHSLNKTYGDEYHSFIPASYVKLVEGAGARVVPIWIGKNRSYYTDILSKVNGVLFPGGATLFNQSNGYADAGKSIYKFAEKINKNGSYFPIWGTSLGFQLLMYAAANGTDHRVRCAGLTQALPLDFDDDFQKTRMFEYAPDHVIDTLRNENSTIGLHKWCITRDGLARVSLSDEFRVISESNDLHGLRFISALEHTSMPFYGVQFHPEKNIYEWVEGKFIPHSFASIQASQYFANFFVNEARKNDHSFPNVEEESKNLIYNYGKTYTGLQKSLYQECYLFRESNGYISV